MSFKTETYGGMLEFCTWKCFEDCVGFKMSQEQVVQCVSMRGGDLAWLVEQFRAGSSLITPFPTFFYPSGQERAAVPMPASGGVEEYTPDWDYLFQHRPEPEEVYLDASYFANSHSSDEFRRPPASPLPASLTQISVGEARSLAVTAEEDLVLDPSQLFPPQTIEEELQADCDRYWGPEADPDAEE